MFNKYSAIVLSGAFVLSGLSGCGGSSSSTPDVPAPPAAPTVMVSGTVTDMPIPNATVILTVNGQSFQAPLPTDADGNYMVEIESTDPDAMVLCEAFDPNGPTRFSAMLDDFGGLQDAASDGMVESVNITNVTTAQFLLASQFDNDGSIDSVEELQDLSEQVDADQVLQIAAAIKIVVEGLEGVALPAGYDDVQDLASAIITGDSTFIDDVATTNPGVLDNAMSLVISDGNATMPFDADLVPGVYISDQDFKLFALFADGTGVEADFAEETIEEIPGWAVTSDGKLSVSDATGAVTDVLTLVGQAGNVLTLAFEPDSAGDVPDVSTVMRFGFDSSFDASSVAGSYSDEDEANEFTVFLADGTGYELDGITGAQSDAFIWTAPAPGVLEITQTDNQDFERIFVLEGTEGNSMNLLSVEYNPDFTLDDMEIFSASRMDDILAGPVTDIANAVMVNGKTYALTEDNDVALFTFNADGTLLEVAEFFEGDSWEFYQDEGYWIIDADGVFSVAWPDGETEDLSVLSGLGGDTMSLQYTDDDGTVGTDTLTRVVAFDASTVAGAYDIVDASGSPVGEVLTLFEGGGGFYQDDESGEDLTWVVNADGQLVFTLYGGSGTDVETDNFYLLSDSTADNLHVIRVFRVNGQLEGDADFPGEAPEAVLEMNFARQQQ